MKIEFVSYEQSLKLKELGFDEDCFAYYENNNIKITFPSTPVLVGSEIIPAKNIKAPLKQTVLRWFRNEHKLFGIIDVYNDYMFYIEILDINGNTAINIEDNDFSTYEEAEEFCINKLIELVENGKK